MADINELNLQSDEIIGDINWTAPERGAFAPKLEAGKDYLFHFELEDDPWSEREYDHKPVLGVRFKATTSITDESGAEKEVTIRFNKAEFFKSPKMIERKINSDGEELMRALGIRIEGPFTWDAAKQAFQEASGRATFTATVGWSAFQKETKVSIRTNPRRDDLPWPKGSDGKFEQPTSFPDGEKTYGREEITRYRIPKGR